jgi:hypothetical protein
VREISSRARNSKEKNQRERETEAPVCFALVAAVDVEHFGFCMYAHRIFFSVLSILLLASKLLARSLAPWRGTRGIEDLSDGQSSRRSLYYGLGFLTAVAGGEEGGRRGFLSRN